MPTPHTSRPGKPATPRQQAFLRQLAQRTGTTFSPPVDRADASRQIDAMQGRKRSSYDERWYERRQLDRDLATRRGDGARVRAGEVTGYGSTARWSTADVGEEQ